MTERRLLAAALAFTALSIFVTPFARDLFVGDETKYGQVIREMRATGSWLLPTLDGRPFTHKPPLHFWLIDLLTFPLGTHSMWAFVLPSIAAFLALLYMMNRLGGPLAALVCATSLMVWGSAQTARMDVGFTLFIVIGLALMERALDRGDSRALLGSGAALGIATLIKGPMAPVIGIVTYAIEVIRRRRRRAGNRQPAAGSQKPVPGHRPPATRLAALTLMLAIPALWFVPAMLLGGSAYTREVVMKQTVGRAVASWVHNAPPWFYIEHLPASLFPWFFLGAVALAARRRARPFLVSWIAAVFVPYSIMSSKLDVYMMALIPPVALLIADFLHEADAVWARRGVIANRIALALLALVCIAGARLERLLPPDVSAARVTAVFAVMAVVAVVALAAAWRANLLASTVIAGVAPIVALLILFVPLHGTINDLASTRPLIAALRRQHVPPEQIALYACPYLWSRDLPPELERVRYVSPEELRLARPAVTATSRAHAHEIAYALAGAMRYDSVQMIGKWFDVYRR
jgi:4-amino-4-deoxy-L-arabinose transferase-like glycosyltransferase